MSSQSVIQSEINDFPFDKPMPYDKRSMIMASLASMQSGENLRFSQEKWITLTLTLKFSIFS